VQAFGGPTALLADAASYVASVASLLAIRSGRESVESEGHEGSTPASRGRMRREVREGVRFVARHGLLRPVAVCTAILNLFSMMGFAVVVLFAVRDLHMRAGVIGVALTVGNVGFLAGAPLASRIGRRLGVGPAIIGAAATFALGAALIPLATRSTGLSVLIAGTIVSSFGNVVYNVNARSLIQTITPPRMLGRAIATARVLVWGVIPVGAFLGGVLGTHLGLRPTLLVSAAGGVLAFVPPLLSPVRSLRAMPTPDSASLP
jgi:MFS family permease